MVHKYLLEELETDELTIFVVWGPMLGDEVRADAGPATTTLPDPRVRHFWTGENGLAESLAERMELAPGELAWDTYLVYGPGVRWEGRPPEPDTVMHVGRSLPEEQRLNGEALYRRVAELVDGEGAEPAAD